MDQHLFVFSLIISLFCSGTYASSSRKWKNPGKYDEFVEDGPTIDAISLELKRTYPALKSHRTSVQFYLYTKSTVDSPKLLVNNNVTSLHSAEFDASKRTIFVTHGFRSSVYSDTTQSIKNALLKFNDVNVIGVDWSYYTEQSIVFYLWVAHQTPGVGKYVGRFVSFLVKNGLETDDIHLVGHSLGAHVSGFAGKELKRRGYTAARVTGLDPALPGFSGNDASWRLASTDGQFVDCIHTSGGRLGFGIPIGQADFYPNGGIQKQPGCPWWDCGLNPAFPGFYGNDDCSRLASTDGQFVDFYPNAGKYPPPGNLNLGIGICSHARAHEYFVESIDPTHQFYAKTCKDVIGGTPYGCFSKGARMGYFASPRYLGEFYLETRSSSPFSMNITRRHHSRDLLTN